MDFIKAKVLKIEELAEGVRHFILSRPDNFEFKAGQFVMIKKELDGKEVKRAYSISSCPTRKGEFDLCIKRVENGIMSNHFFELKEGDEISFGGPLGHLTPKKDGRDIILVGVGSGIAPLRSMVHYLLNENYDKKVALVTGARSDNHLLYDEEMKNLMDKHDNFSYHPIVSKCHDPNCKEGRVQDLIKDFSVNESQFYLCGFPKMVNETKELLKSKGIDLTNVKFEAY